MKSPDQVYPDTDTRVLAVGGTYIMAIKGGDLQLLINGPNPQVFWSLKKTSGFTGDLSKVSYAGTSTCTTTISLVIWFTTQFLALECAVTD